MSRAMWIAVPGGRTADGGGVLRVVVVPVLDGGGTLAEEGMASWPPPELTADDGRLVVDAATDVGADPAVSLSLRPSVAAVPGLWERFFGSIDVRPPVGAVVRGLDVQPTTMQADAIITAYSEVARGLTDEDGRAEFATMSRGRASELAGIAPPPPPTEGTGTPSGRPIDFHLATSVLREHPAVLRALGLILELTVTASDVARLPERGVLRVGWPTAPPGIPAVDPRSTSYLRDRFLPAPGPGSDLADAGGMVALARETGDGPVWRLHTVDVDHAARGLAAVAAAGPTPESDGALPALRTAGVLLARVGRAADLADRGARNGRPADDVLVAEHLTLGYRVDVRIVGLDWHSLCRREARYAVNGVAFPTPPTEEGHVKVGGGIDRGDNMLRTDEVVARWDGWSLAVPRPELRDRPAGAGTPSVPLPFVLDTSGVTVEPGTLLRLRFGDDYQVRARVADVAGGGPVLEEPSLDGCDSELVRFRRHEPVLPPDVRVPAGAGPFGPGASPTALVVRSAEGIADALADSARDLVPPSATFEVIERHGRLDGDEALTLLARTDLPDPAAGGVVGFVRGDPGEPPRDLEPENWTSSRPGPHPDGTWPDLQPKSLELRARVGAEPTLQWEDGGVLVVRLAPAEEATVQISSLIGEDARGAFSISDWLTGGGDGTPGTTSAAEDLFAAGRHPMATPARSVTVRHAVRAPRGTPQGRLAVSRTEGATTGLVHVAEDGDPRAGIDPPSTLAVDVAASWSPVDDRGDPPADRRPVGRIAVGRADARLGTLTQEFGDTKHRAVTYSLTAMSRFRDCFAPSEDGGAFQVEGTIGPVSVPSSARPVAPVVRSVTPGFLWQEERAGTTIVRRRLGNRLRVELEAPWFLTGDGEQLAVVGTPGGIGEDVAPLVTQAGRDPVWQTGPPPRFPVPAGTAVGVTLAEGPTAVVVAHGVFEVGGSAFADVVLGPFDSYSPLVQLAVARYQPESLPGLTISPVVRTDFVPLLPDRTVTVEVGAELGVTLTGVTPAGPRLNRCDAILEATGDAGDGPLVLGDGGPWHTVATASGAVGTRLTLPNPGGTLRVRVREVEMIGRDTAPSLGTVQELEERVVFADTVPL
ncbi:hypothetical protein [Cellulomonas sp. ICMP 17802]|uniref:hypothetical protein n=1 Tax=Cellulomonas sp. ICMP 17802 TaxID=3239199 RepID=UPI00351AB803